MEKLAAAKILSLPQHPPLKEGDVVKIKGEEDVYVLLLEPLEDEPGAYRGLPFKGRHELVPVDLLVHEELIEEVVGKAHPLLVEIAREMEKTPVWSLKGEDEFVLTLRAIQLGSEYYLTEPWERVVVCKKATILITEGADLSSLKFSRFGEASVRELPSGELEVVLLAGTASFSGRVEVSPEGRVLSEEPPPVKVFVGDKELTLEDGEDLVLYARGDESLPEVRVLV